MAKISIKTLFLVLAFLFASPVFAQPFAGQLPVGGPVISPYLNLTNGGDGGVSNYFTLVLPQIQQQQQQQQLQRQQSQISQLQRGERAFVGSRGGSPIQTPQIRSTGQRSTFNYYSHFYTIQQGRRQ